MKKKIAALILIIVCTMQSGAFATAPERVEDEQETISLLRYEALETAIATVTVSGTTATYSLNAKGCSDVTSISATLQLQRLVGGKWENYGQSWNASATGRTLRTSGTKTVPTGYTWRLMATITCYTANGNPTEVVYS